MQPRQRPPGSPPSRRLAEDAAKAAEEEAKKGTVSQRNALRSAESYLDFQGFSRKGLIKQLEFEGYTAEQAAFGVTSTGLG